MALHGMAGPPLLGNISNKFFRADPEGAESWSLSADHTPCDWVGGPS